MASEPLSRSSSTPETGSPREAQPEGRASDTIENWEYLGKSTVDFSGQEVKAPDPSFGRYQILEKIARGGMGVVLKAHDSLLGRTVALKIIRSGLLAGPKEVERFYREAKAVAHFNHPHIVKIYDFGKEHGYHYFTMALAAQGSLNQHLGRFAADPRAAVQLMVKMARAVNYVHDQGHVHRDLKPGNILLEAGDEPLVSDFGLVKAMEADTELTRQGEAPGTPAYMAPEQAGKKTDEVGPHTDIWALGVILYEVLCEQKPFKGPSRDDVASQILSRDPPRPRTLRKGLDRSLETIILKCLEKNPRNRYPSAAALADDLDCWLRGEPIKARPWPVWRKVLRAARRRPVVSALGLAILSCGVSVPWTMPVLDPNWVVERSILPALTPTEGVTLIKDHEDPLWFRWRIPGIISEKNVGQPYFAISSGSVSLLELLPRVPLDRFCFRAEVKPAVSTMGETGFYLGYRSHPGNVHSFVLLCFASNGDRAGEIRGELCHRSLTNPHSDRGTPLGSKNVIAKGRSLWHTLKVEVTPEEIAFFVNAAPLFRVTSEQRLAAARNLVMPRPNLPAVHHDFAPAAGLGLYVDKGEASFRNVVVEPF